MGKKDELSNMDISLFALNRLGGTSKKIHTEHIAWEAFQLAPERFSWRLPEFRERGFPDKAPIRFALEQAKKKENGNLVAGRAGGDVGGHELEGWVFTINGITWMKSNLSRISQSLEIKASQLRPIEVKRFVNKIRSEASYIVYVKDGSIENVTRFMFTDMLNCTPDAPMETIKIKFERILSLATLVGDKNIINFLESCNNKFIVPYRSKKE